MNNGTPAPETPPKTKWYWTTRFLIIALLSAGPFALPLLWFNKKYSWPQKLLWSVVVLALSYYMAVYTVDLFQKVLAQYRDLGLIQ